MDRIHANAVFAQLDSRRTQWANGKTDWLISLDDDNLTVGQSRQLAAALVEAADEVDRWASNTEARKPLDL